MDARGHQELARAFGRGLVERRRLDVDEAVRVEVPARRHRRAVAQHQVLLHLRPAQVEHAVLSRTVSDRFSSSSWNGGVSDGLSTSRSCASTSISPGREVRVDGAVRARAHPARHGDDELVAQLLGDGERRRAVGVADDLHQAFAVAQIDEDHAAMVAAAMRPAHQRDGLAEVAAVDAAAVVGAFQGSLQGMPAAVVVRAPARCARDRSVPTAGIAGSGLLLDRREGAAEHAAGVSVSLRRRARGAASDGRRTRAPPRPSR